MGAVLIDNWTLFSFFHQTPKINRRSTSIHDTEYSVISYRDIAYEHFLCSLVLWDEVRYVSNIDSDAIIEHPTNEDVSVSMKKILGLLRPVEKNITNLIEMPFLFSRNSSLEERAMDYLFASNCLGVNYLPHPQRAKYMHENNIINKLVTRADFINKLDCELLEFYNKLNEELGYQKLQFQAPVIIDYIKKHIANKNDEIEAILEIRNNMDFVLFRKRMDELENVINKGSIQSIKDELSEITECAKELMYPQNKSKSEVTITIGTSPGISFPIKSNKKKIHCSFYTELLKFGLNNRA